MQNPGCTYRNGTRLAYSPLNEPDGRPCGPTDLVHLAATEGLVILSGWHGRNHGKE